jgi:hypothetical protein
MRRVWGASVAAACAVAIVLTACGGGGGGAPKREPSELGKEIGETYLTMIAELGVIVAGSEDPATLRPQVDALMTKYVEAFVALGRQREALASTDRQKCDTVAQTRMRQVPADTMEAIDAAADAGKAADAELGAHFDALRRITRYAAFDQLRNQLPDEAKRLGIQ